MTDTTAPRTAAGQRLLDLYFGNEDDLAGGGIEHLVRAIEAEAIEPLLALVRAAETTNHRKMRPLPGEAPCCMACGEDWPCPEYVALAALPESVRVAARKPE